LHFSGHGSQIGDLFTQSLSGDIEELPLDILAEVIRTLQSVIPLRLVFLNACWSLTRVDELCQVVDAVVGMSDKIGDKEAIKFAEKFYTALREELALNQCVEFGKKGLELNGLSDEDIPDFRVRENIDPKKFHIAHLLPLDDESFHYQPEKPPLDYVHRLKEFDEVKKILISSQAPVVALEGAGGYGKTTLVQAICADSEIQSKYRDGILWIKIGEHVDNLAFIMENLNYVLSGTRNDALDLAAVSRRLEFLLQDLNLLLVVDDVWHSSDLLPFLRGGNHCIRLVTTRNDDILPTSAYRIKIDRLDNPQAIKLLSSQIADAEPHKAQFSTLANRFGNWALLLKLANGVLLQQIRLSKPIPNALNDTSRIYDEYGLTAFDAENAQSREFAIALCIKVSLDHLTPDQAKNFYKLSIFPEDLDIPLAALEKLWELNDLNTEKLVVRLNSFSLLLDCNLQTRTVRLHDVMRKYLREQTKTNEIIFHQELLTSGASRYSEK